MDIEIRKLTPDLAEDYAHFFDVTPHDINEDEAKCYCVTWRSDASYANEGHWFPTREDRRAHAIHFIKTGSLQAIWPIAVMNRGMVQRQRGLSILPRLPAFLLAD